MTQEIQPLPDPEAPTPQDWGFPEHPTTQQRHAWASQQLFLASLAKHGRICDAADDAGVTVWAAEQWDFKDMYGFKKRKAWALARYDAWLDAEIDRRAVEGTDKPIYWRGQKVDTIKEYSDNLLMFRRKQRDPSFRDNYDPRPQQQQQQVQITRIIIHGVDAQVETRVVEGEIAAGEVVEGEIKEER